MRKSRVVAAVFGAAFVVGATTQLGAGSIEPSAPLGHPRIDFAPCVENVTADCGTLRVPVDHQKPWGEKFDLAVVRARATGKRIGVLFVHPGAHEPGVASLLAVLEAPGFKALRERFDLASVDPRGAGKSRPLDCGIDFPTIPSSLPDDEIVAVLDDTSRLIAERCLAEDRAFVLSINGTNFARDIDALREALGERQLTLAVASNTGPVGAIYANLFPRRVRAMVLDSTVGPDFEDYLVHRSTEQRASAETAVQRLDQLCRKDAACRLRDVGVVSAHDELFSALEQAPVTSPDGRLLTAQDLATVVSLCISVEPLGPVLVDALAAARDGDFGLLFALRSSVPPGSDVGDPFVVGADPIIARFCNDYGTRRSAADYLTIEKADFAAHPRAFGRLFIPSNVALCAAWPPARPPAIEPVRLETPVLILGSEFDSDTPFAWSQRMAQALGSQTRVVRYRGSGHGVAGRGHACIDEAFFSYVLDLKLPPDGLSCEADPLSFAGAAQVRR